MCNTSTTWHQASSTALRYVYLSAHLLALDTLLFFFLLLLPLDPELRLLSNIDLCSTTSPNTPFGGELSGRGGEGEDEREQLLSLLTAGCSGRPATYAPILFMWLVSEWSRDSLLTFRHALRSRPYALVALVMVGRGGLVVPAWLGVARSCSLSRSFLDL